MFLTQKHKEKKKTQIVYQRGSTAEASNEGVFGM
jgi:hypothetical protein